MSVSIFEKFWPIETGLEYFCGSSLPIEVTSIGGIVTLPQYFLCLLIINTPTQEVIRSNFKQVWFIPYIVISFMEKFLALFPGIIFRNELCCFIVRHVGKPWSFFDGKQLFIRKFFKNFRFILGYLFVHEPWF